MLMLSAAATAGDRVGGLALGADDYLTKPFAFTELIARIRALAQSGPAASSTEASPTRCGHPDGT